MVKKFNRSRDKATSSDKRVNLTKRDLLWFEFLHRHGERLPTSYLHEYTADRWKHFTASKLRLTDLFHEKNTAHKGTYILRPFQQFNMRNYLENEVLHVNSPRAIQALKDEALFSNYVPSPGGSFHHQVITSCITASFELCCLINGNIRYIPQHEILENANSPLKIDIDGGLIPDGFFGLEKNGKSV